MCMYSSGLSGGGWGGWGGWQVIREQKLPKELLQSSLRPILVNLATFKNLSMPLLQGLARLLELLSNWFNVTLGDKLKDHLSKWLDPAKDLNGTKWSPGEEPKIAAGRENSFLLSRFRSRSRFRF